MKIGDFGITKRVSNNDTALQTTTGTPHYLAPEVSHFVDTGNEESDAYTNAVDIWSFACVLYQILALQLPFPKYPRSLLAFCKGGPFPDAPLAKRTSDKGIDFVKSILVPFPALRPRAQELMQSDWLQFEDSLPESFPDSGNQISDSIPSVSTLRDLAGALSVPISVVPLQGTQTTKTGLWKEDTSAATIRRPYLKSPSQVIPQTVNDNPQTQHQLMRTQLSLVSNTSNDPEIKAWANALAFYDNQEFDEAVEQFNSLSSNLKSSKSQFNSGVIHATIGEHEKAVRTFYLAI